LCEYPWWLGEHFYWFNQYPWQLIFKSMLPTSLTCTVIIHGFVSHMLFHNQYCVDYKIFHLFFIFSTLHMWFLYFIVFIFLLCIKILRLNSTYTLSPIYWHMLLLFLNFRFHVLIRFEFIHIDQHRVSFKLLNGH
jgi:hypothetical protein